MQPGYYVGHTRHLLRSQVGENVPNVTSSKEQKQMLLYLFIFVLGSTLI